MFHCPDGASCYMVDRVDVTSHDSENDPTTDCVEPDWLGRDHLDGQHNRRWHSGVELAYDIFLEWTVYFLCHAAA